MAARLYVQAVAEDRALNRTDTFVAGTYSHGSIGYFNDYFCTLEKYGTDPQVWSFHDWLATGLRLSFCTLTHGIATGCSASSTAASDWSVQPRRAFGTLSPGSSVVSNVTGEQPAPGGLFWVTCFDYHTGATCETIPPRTVAFFTSPTWRLSSSAPSNIAPGTYPLTVSDWAP